MEFKYPGSANRTSQSPAAESFQIALLLPFCSKTRGPPPRISAISWRVFRGPEVAFKIDVRFLTNLFALKEGPNRLGHQLAAEALREGPPLSGAGRIYVCIRCRQRFMVRGNRVALLNRHDNVLARIETGNGTNQPSEGICPGRELAPPKPPITVYIVHLQPPAISWDTAQLQRMELKSK